LVKKVLVVVPIKVLEDHASDLLPLLPVPDDLMLNADNQAAGLAASDWPQSRGRPSLKLCWRVNPPAHTRASRIKIRFLRGNESITI
jgi:hypothetical protein